VELKL